MRKCAAGIIYAVVGALITTVAFGAAFYKWIFCGGEI